MDINELRELIKLLEDSALSEIEIEENDRRVRLSRHGSGGYAPMQHYAYPPPAPAAAPGQSAGLAAAAEALEAAEDSGVPEGMSSIDSPMVGTFYASPGPGDPPFVLPGARVEAEQTVCIVEAMKIMNEVTAKTACIIEKVLVENGQPVEFGQPLFYARPVS